MHTRVTNIALCNLRKVIEAEKILFFHIFCGSDGRQKSSDDFFKTSLPRNTLNLKFCWVKLILWIKWCEICLVIKVILPGYTKAAWFLKAIFRRHMKAVWFLKNASLIFVFFIYSTHIVEQFFIQTKMGTT